jgi:ribosomal protein S18 acetylase RimI-like enzyme
MPVDETVTYLEMTSPEELVPGREPPEPFALERLRPSDLDLFRSTCVAIGDPYGWTSRPPWTEAQWMERLERDDVEPWLARVGDEPAGLVELEAQRDHAVEIVVLGLLPAFTGRGFGGHLLTVGTRQAWEMPHGDGGRTRRVWLHTSSFDHPHAQRNYEARGFRVFDWRHQRHDFHPAMTRRRPDTAPAGGA